MYSWTANKNSKTLIFLHGWGGRWQSWYPVLEKLKTEFNIYALDLPGFGETPLSSVCNLQDYSDYLAKFIKAYDIKNPVLIGHSFGGAVSCRYVLNHPQKVQKLVLVDAAPIRYPQNIKQKSLVFVSKIFKSVLSLPLLNQFSSSAKKLFYKTMKLENSGYADLENEALKKVFTKVIREDLSSELAKIKTPTLIVWGEKDTATPLCMGQKINELIDGSQIIVFPGLGHFAYLDAEDKFIQSIKEFVNEA
jgi:pimeloyl-ACP methyl ester carboxylesterase